MFEKKDTQKTLKKSSVRKFNLRLSYFRTTKQAKQEVIILTKYVIKFLEHDWKIQVLSPVFYQLQKILQQFHS